MRFALALLLFCITPFADAATAPKTKSEVVVPAPPPAMIAPAEAAPAPQPQPIIVQPSPAPQVILQMPARNEVFDWIWSALLGVGALIFGIKTLGELRRPSLTDADLRVRIEEQLNQLLAARMGPRLGTAGRPPAIGHGQG